ncbi:MAG: hypothetical protein M1813_009696 [Trichoglossum hirsutum]|nr:MAG: hypothetical protein M1813_009696 [Trichoglossum hirsutum]
MDQNFNDREGTEEMGIDLGPIERKVCQNYFDCLRERTATIVVKTYTEEGSIEHKLTVDIWTPIAQIKQILAQELNLETVRFELYRDGFRIGCETSLLFLVTSGTTFYTDFVRLVFQGQVVVCFPLSESRDYCESQVNKKTTISPKNLKLKTAESHCSDIYQHLSPVNIGRKER